MEVLGHVVCLLCPNLVLREVAARTGGICSDCFAGGKGPDMRHIEVVGRGYRIRVPLRKRRPQKRRPHNPNHHTAEKAKLRALKRLKAIFPDLYDCLHAEERAAAGLAPWPTEMAVRHEWDPDCAETLKFAAAYHALNRGDQ